MIKNIIYCLVLLFIFAIFPAFSQNEETVTLTTYI